MGCNASHPDDLKWGYYDANTTAINTLVPILQEFVEKHCSLETGLYAMQNDMCAAFYEYIVNNTSLRIRMTEELFIKCVDTLFHVAYPNVLKRGFKEKVYLPPRFPTMLAWTNISLNSFPRVNSLIIVKK
jgi:hypothetical protein